VYGSTHGAAFAYCVLLLEFEMKKNHVPCIDCVCLPLLGSLNELHCSVGKIENATIARARISQLPTGTHQREARTEDEKS
jgi:hypothetical protein